jgi:putative transposase
VKYAFIKDHEEQYSVQRMCSTLDVHPSGYYAWRHCPQSARAKEDKKLTGKIKQSWLESGAVYGYRKVHRDLRDMGHTCGVNRVHRLMRAEGLKSQSGYRKPRHRGGKPSTVAPNHLGQQFDVQRPNDTWVTDITYVRTHEGWLYLAVVLDLFSRQIIGWSMQARIDRELVVSALLMAIWRRQPTDTVTVHSDQGVQFTSYDWQDFLAANNLRPSMSRRGNCHDNAVVESFFQLLKRERIKRRIYATREDARADIFDYIEMFYNPVRQHGYNNGLSPVKYEQQYFERSASI